MNKEEKPKAKLLKLALNGTALTNEQIAEHLEEQAKWIRDGDFGEVDNVMTLVCKSSGAIQRNNCGKRMSFAEAVGYMVISIIREATDT